MCAVIFSLRESDILLRNVISTLRVGDIGRWPVSVSLRDILNYVPKAHHNISEGNISLVVAEYHRASDITLP